MATAAFTVQGFVHFCTEAETIELCALDKRCMHQELVFAACVGVI